MRKVSKSRKVFQIINISILLIIAVLMILPLIQVISASISSRQYVEANQVFILPRGFNLEAYKILLTNAGMIKAFFNSVTVTASSTALGLLLTTTLAYPLSRDEYMIKKSISLLLTFTLIFSAPLIPQYLLVKNLGFDNTLLAVIIPAAMSAFYVFIMRSFFKGIPKDLIYAAKIDGCSELAILGKIIIPLAKPAFASIGLFYAVNHWNALQAPLIFLRKKELHTLQMKLYDVVMQSSMDMPELTVNEFSPTIIKMSTIVVATLPILLVYPFLQKYFQKGTSLGAIKG